MAIWGRGRKPQRAVKGVSAMAISGLWLGSAARCEEGLGCPINRLPTFVQIWPFAVKFFSKGFVRVGLDAESFADGENFEEEGKMAVFGLWEGLQDF